MKGRFLALVIAPILAGAAAVSAEDREEREVERLDVQYGSLGVGRYQLSLAIRHATGPFEVGWQVVWRKYTLDDPVATGEQVTIGPLWAWSAVKGSAVGLRFSLDPWVAVSTRVRDTSDQAVVGLPYGAESNLLLHATIRLGRTVSVLPSVGLVSKVARRSTSLETVVSGWDSQAGWRVAIPLRLGAQQRVRFEAAYSQSWHAARYLGQQGFGFSLGWAF